MDHVAIMKKSWGLTEKILDGRKKIESRWYLSKRAPWDKIKKGETVYFKNSGEQVKIKAKVAKILQFCDLNPKKVKKLLDEYGNRDGLEKTKIPEFFKRFREKRYCMLIFLKSPVKIRPFNIDKTSFGAMAAWIAVDRISRIKK